MAPLARRLCHSAHLSSPLVLVTKRALASNALVWPPHQRDSCNGDSCRLRSCSWAPARSLASSPARPPARSLVHPPVRSSIRPPAGWHVAHVRAAAAAASEGERKRDTYVPRISLNRYFCSMLRLNLNSSLSKGILALLAAELVLLRLATSASVTAAAAEII